MSAETNKKTPTVTVAGGIVPAAKEAIEEHRWTVRQTVSQFVTEAVMEKIERLGLDLDAAQARLDAAAAELAEDAPAEDVPAGKSPKTA